ncbi:UbiX family flavin prenyltransferase [Gammaproteobacteria bacterium]|nr:UbiX family flavin prenyltransferase [Gammaproteobacteria bacterium]MDB2445173.1 UbiX family flavin prenyltransferase [Gammaproteobacteria bacterium]MDG1953168.1 UbiX family flavin prenyltransferase [Gammaproteobacteria bacterium]MDG2117468.1 UbiX family flavin prenyltransferase [Gammaproteobacteria bacterium]
MAAIKSVVNYGESRVKIIVGMSGASGVIYGVRMLEVLRDVAEVETHLVMSDAAKLNIAVETDLETQDVVSLADYSYSNRDIGASIASGSFKTDGMVVAPCAIKTLSAIANSYSDSLIVRAADVVLKECRRLVLVPRETPLHVGHCELMMKACQLGAVMAPPMPAHYILPKTVDDLVNHHVGRILDLFDLDSGLVQRWHGVNKSE